MNLSALIQDVQTHLQSVIDDPRKPLNQNLLESVDRQVTEVIGEGGRDDLLNQLSTLLPILQQDPTPITALIQILVSSSQPYDFKRVLSIQPSVNFVAGLSSPTPPINLTTLSLLEKAKYHTSDIDIVAGRPEVVGALVRLWLCTPDTAVATRAHDVLFALLSADPRSSTSQVGSMAADDGLLWRRIFRDKDIYGSLYSICSLSTVGQEGQISRRDKTVAQARLLEMLLCIDSVLIRTSQLRDIEAYYGVKTGGGLLHFAALQMVDYQDDVLMHMTLMDFCSRYLGRKHVAIKQNNPDDTFEDIPTHALRFLQENGLHERNMSYYLHPESHDSLDLTYLYGPSANYLAVYSSEYHKDLLRNHAVVDVILARLTNVLQTVSPGQWAQGQTPKHDLHVMASMPRVTLIPRTRDSPLFLVPSKTASPDTYNTLTHILRGEISGHENLDLVAEDESAAARALYFLYMERFPNFWTQIISAAEVVAMKDVARAAIGLIGSIISANWNPLPEIPSNSSPFSLPPESKLLEKCHTYGTQLPQSGIEVIMSEPALGIVVPYLMKPAQTFSNLVGGGRGDVESAAYTIAVAKHDVLVLLHEKLKTWVGAHSDAQEMVATVGRRVAQGPMGGTSEIGGRVGTLEL